MGKFRDLTGQTFGRLKVIERAAPDGTKRTMWKCSCKCGNTVVVRSPDLLREKTTSCGCFRKEQLVARSTKHGMCETRLYREYLSMKDRCYREKCKDYPDYGGRGITICEEWRESFEAFRDWALANGYRDDLTIERKDVNGNYCPDNCKWATAIEQARNKRNNHILEFQGEQHTLTEWAQIIGIKRGTLARRISLGWPIDRAITEPVKERCRDAV